MPILGIIRLSLLLGCLVLFQCSQTTLSKSDRKRGKGLTSEKSSSSIEKEYKGLDSHQGERETIDSIISQQHQEVDVPRANIKSFNGTVMAYVTPWNGLGYDVSKNYGRKFDFVSPVWLQLKATRGDKETFKIQGGHDIDQNWIKSVRSRGSKILPRLLFDGWQSEDFQIVLTNAYVASACSNTIVDFLLKHKFDGVVLEVWSQLGRQVHRELAHFLKHITGDLKRAQLLSVIVIPPSFNKYQQTDHFSADDFNSLQAHTDYFSLMTYDYSNVMSPGPNAPLSWIEACIKAIEPTGELDRRSKILMGLNFYGMLYMPGDGHPIVGHQFLHQLESHRPVVEWNEKYYEHVFRFRHANKDHSMYYPTISSISVRLQLAQRLKVGIAIWEIGQGLPHFYQMF